MAVFGEISPEYSSQERAAVAIVPVPYDGTSTWIKGADKGPEAILEASVALELYDIETDTEVYKKGIFVDDPVCVNDSPESMVSAVEKTITGHLKNKKFPVTIGGEHSVSIGSINAHASAFDSLSILQLDAHSDLREDYMDSRYNHACVMARAREKCPIVQVGIRSMDRSELIHADRDRIFFAKDITCNQHWFDSAINLLTEDVYITIDLDVFDPSIMPSTGTPEPGGLLWYDTLAFLKQVFRRKNVRGFDVVELCPNKENKAPDFLAAKLIYTLLSYQFMQSSE